MLFLIKKLYRNIKKGSYDYLSFRYIILERMKNRNKILKRKNILILIVAILISIITTYIMTIFLLNRVGLIDKNKISKKFYESGKINNTNLDSNIYNNNEIKDISENAIDISSSRSEALAHVRFSKPIYSIQHLASNNILNAGTRKLSNFLDNQTKGADFDTYFKYDTDKQNLVCEKEGYYILNYNARCAKSGGDGSLVGNFIINGVQTKDVDSWICGSNSEVQTRNSMTIYLFIGDTIDFLLINNTSISYLTVYFEIFPN